jgi:hypothetical protein
MSGDVVLAALIVLLGLTFVVLMRLQDTPERAHALARAQQAYDLARNGWAEELDVYRERFRRLGAAKAWALIAGIAVALAVVFLTEL